MLNRSPRKGFRCRNASIFRVSNTRCALLNGALDTHQRQLDVRGRGPVYIGGPERCGRREDRNAEFVRSQGERDRLEPALPNHDAPARPPLLDGLLQIRAVLLVVVGRGVLVPARVRVALRRLVRRIVPDTVSLPTRPPLPLASTSGTETLNVRRQPAIPRTPLPATPAHERLVAHGPPQGGTTLTACAWKYRRVAPTRRRRGKKSWLRLEGKKTNASHGPKLAAARGLILTSRTGLVCRSAEGRCPAGA